jgi:hypothetical protein
MAEEWQTQFTEFANKNDSDFYLFSAGIFDQQVDNAISAVRRVKNKRTNASLALCTLGGSADAAFQLARIFKRKYTKFTLYVFGVCKSAGTLVAVGADEIVMSEFGQFGPLDVQLTDKEDVFAQTPALDIQQSVATLSKLTFDTFWDYFLSLAKAGLGSKTASEAARNLALGISSPIAEQIDPLLLGRVDRSMKIAEAYSDRLRKDFKGKARLSGDYPSHSFVIDYDEAKTIFPNLREPNAEEVAIEETIRGWGRVPRPRTDWIGNLSQEKTSTQNEQVPNNGGAGEHSQTQAPTATLGAPTR